MVQGKFKVLDSDIHIIEPPDLWPRYIDPAFRAQAPIGLTEDEGDLRLAHNGKGWGRLAAAMARAYNDWLHEFCQENPERLLGAGMISPFDVNDAVAEARRCVREYGFRAMFLRPNEVNGRNWHDPYYEPLWAALEELE